VSANASAAASGRSAASSAQAASAPTSGTRAGACSKGRERLTEQQRRSLCELFQREPLLAEAWGLKERFRAIYRSHSREQAEQRLELFLNATERAQIPSFRAFANGLRDWQPELLAYFDQPTTNGYAEGVINKIKVIKRHAYGLPSFDSFRTRILIACG